ncbi:MAG: hypothetical protein K2X27_18245 [Candidatus Obscuribacterales bacterium]|nr:hypothetical protein [Candidatus Obscuribacterales bacterium]
MKNHDESAFSHPVPLDRNRSILLARDLLEINDFVILAIKQSRPAAEHLHADEAQVLTSICVTAAEERILLDVLVRPDKAVSSELLKIHGCDSAHTFTAPTFAEIYKILEAGFARSRVVCFDSHRVRRLLSALCIQEALPELNAKFVDLQTSFTKFVGEQANGTYKTQILPKSFDCREAGITALSECRIIWTLLKEMAASSQINDSARTFNKSWSSAFYKPKSGPAEKIREILGLSD